MKMASPCRLNATPVGYQPVGTNPATRLCPGVLMSTSAAVLLSALATRSRRPSGETATAFGVDPGGASGKSAIEICSVALDAHGSTTQTALVFAHATNRRPSAPSTIAFGCSPTAIDPFDASVCASKSMTCAPPQSET